MVLQEDMQIYTQTLYLIGEQYSNHQGKQFTGPYNTTNHVIQGTYYLVRVAKTKFDCKAILLLQSTTRQMALQCCLWRPHLYKRCSQKSELQAQITKKASIPELKSNLSHSVGQFNVIWKGRPKRTLSNLPPKVPPSSIMQGAAKEHWI